MGKKATKAADNMYYLARSEAAEHNSDFSSREKAAEIIGIDRTRLARIELDTLPPYPEEVKAMARAYNVPELCNMYCARECPIGRSSVREVTIDDFDRLALKVLGSLKDIDSLRASLIAISEDGIIEENERPAFQKILDSLEKISTNAKALQLWAMKNIRLFEPNMAAHPQFGTALSHAAAHGVTIMARDCIVTSDSLTLDAPVPVRLPET